MNFVSSSSVIFVLLICKQCLKKLIFPFYKLCSLFCFLLNVFIYQKEEIFLIQNAFLTLQTWEGHVPYVTYEAKLHLPM